MKNKYPSVSEKALLIFTDIIDSSVYSSILGIYEYAEKVLDFQNIFEKLGREYFYDKSEFDKADKAWCKVEAKGDEGLVFLVDKDQEGKDLIPKAVRFAYELKAWVKLLNNLENNSSPRELKIATGIHYGTVSLIIEPREDNEGIYRSKISEIIGYSINYAKRIESSSRMGKFSQIFLSIEASELLSGCPIVLYKHLAPLKGIGSSETVYEVQSAFLDDIPLYKKKIKTYNYEHFIDYFDQLKEDTEFLRESWLKGLIVSILNSRKENIKGDHQKQKYQEKISQLAWQKQNENDPILLYIRAVECENEGKFTRAITLYKKILENYPDYIFARIKLINNCHEIIKSNRMIFSEEIFVRDTAEELLEKYHQKLNGNEIDNLKNIIEFFNKKC